MTLMPVNCRNGPDPNLRHLRPSTFGIEERTMEEVLDGHIGSVLQSGASVF
jgi:hypothetical protein